MRKCSVLSVQEKCVLKLPQDAAMLEQWKCKILIAWNAGEDGEQSELPKCLCECKWKSGKKTKLSIHLPCDPEIPLLDIYLRDIKSYIHNILYKNVYKV